MNKQNLLRTLFESMVGKHKCKNKECNNIRRHCSAYCEECSKSYGNKIPMDR